MDAATNTWQSIGPDGAFVRALAIDPRTPLTVYAASTGGVFKSQRLPTTHLRDIRINPAHPNILYTATHDAFGREGHGVFVSRHGGADWTALNEGLPSLDVTALTMDPHNPDILFAEVSGDLLVIEVERPADVTPPASTATLSEEPNEHGWHDGPVTVTLQAAELAMSDNDAAPVHRIRADNAKTWARTTLPSRIVVSIRRSTAPLLS